MLQLISDRLQNVRVALDWSFSPDGDTAAGVALTIASVPLWLSRSLIEECRKRVERALERVAPGGENATRQEMQLLTALGVVFYSQGPTPESEVERYFTESFNLAQKQDARGQGS